MLCLSQDVINKQYFPHRYPEFISYYIVHNKIFIFQELQRISYRSKTDTESPVTNLKQSHEVPEFFGRELAFNLFLSGGAR